MTSASISASRRTRQEKLFHIDPRLLSALLALSITLLGVLLLVCASLREMPMFWRNDGGYPVALREFLLVAFYPAVFLYLALVLFAGWRGWMLMRRRQRSGKALHLAFMLNCGLLASLATVVTWNNVQNLIEGRPFHYHILPEGS